MAAGSIIIDLLMRTGSFETDSKRAEKRLREMQKTAKQAGVVIGTAISAAAIGLTAMVKGAIDSADAMRDLSIRVGVSTETLSAYGYAASQTGTDVDVLAKGLKVLAKNAADAINPTSEQSKVFDALGIRVTDTEGKLRSLSDLIPEIADRFKTMEDGTTKAALAQALFGRAGLELTEFLNQGSDGLAEMTERAKAFGIVVDSDTAAAADNFNDTLGDLKAVSQGYALHLAKELLPDLQSLASEFTNTATEGNKVKEMASDTADFLRGLAGVAHFVSSAFELAGESIAAVVASKVALGKAISGDFAGALLLLKEAANGVGEELDEALGRNQPKPGLFGNVQGRASTVSANPVDMASLATALSNPTATKEKRAGKSDAEKAAERLQADYDALVASQREQIALFGDTSEAAKVRYATEHGELAALAPELKAVAVANAEHLDTLREEAEVKAQLEELDRRRHEAVQDVLVDIASERDLLGMTIEAQDTYNKLKWAGVDANSAYGRSIIEANHALHEEAKAMATTIDLQDAWREGLSDTIVDVVTGAKSMKEAFGDFFDDFAARITEAIANRWIEQLFGETGSNGGGSGGNLLGSLLGAFGFGGARAGGGDVMGGKAYLVGEDGPEMFVPRTAGAVLSAGDTGMAMAGGGMQQTNHFHYAAPPDPRTQQQTAARVGFETQRALSRNGR